MSLAAMTWAINAPISRPTAKLALVCLSDYADEDGVCFPSQKALAAKVGVTERALRDALVWLEENGFVSRTMRHRKDGTRASDAYQLLGVDNRKKSPVDTDNRKKLPPDNRKISQGQPEKSSGLTTFEPPTEPVTAAAREAEVNKFDEILDKLLIANGIGIGFRDERHPGLASLAPILGLIDAGFDLDRDILPAIRAKPNPKARSWSYFVAQIREWSSTRSSAAAVPKPMPKPVTDDVWRQRLQVFSEDGTWAVGWGPKPGEAGCRAPAEMLTRVAA